MASPTSRVIPADHHTALDERIFHAVNADGGWVLDALARALSSRWLGIATGLTLAALLWARRRDGPWRWVAILALAILLSDGVGSQVIRPLVGRMRPAYALPSGSVRWIVPASNVGSIPSLHAANFFAMALVGTAASPALGPALYALAGAVAWSRVYGGVHWPTDVLAGALWGTLAAAVALAIMRRIPRRGGT